VILCEGDSERVVIPRIAEAMGVPLDPSFVAIVPLGGRHVAHFWNLLKNLRVPHATLVDLDLGRVHGGAETIRSLIAKLQEADVDLGEIDQDTLDELEDDELLEDFEGNEWVQLLREQDVFFSHPLDLDFSMLRRFHKSKGLEFHTMIFYGLDNQTWWSLTPNRTEELNSLFVAFTRARQRAFFTLCRQRGQPVTWIETLLAPAGVHRIAM
jgi:hypothetical protein